VCVCLQKLKMTGDVRVRQPWWGWGSPKSCNHGRRLLLLIFCLGVTSCSSSSSSSLGSFWTRQNTLWRNIRAIPRGGANEDADAEDIKKPKKIRRVKKRRNKTIPANQEPLPLPVLMEEEKDTSPTTKRKKKRKRRRRSLLSTNDNDNDDIKTKVTNNDDVDSIIETTGDDVDDIVKDEVEVEASVTNANDAEVDDSSTTPTQKKKKQRRRRGLFFRKKRVEETDALSNACAETVATKDSISDNNVVDDNDDNDANDDVTSKLLFVDETIITPPMENDSVPETNERIRIVPDNHVTKESPPTKATTGRKKKKRKRKRHSHVPVPVEMASAEAIADAAVVVVGDENEMTTRASDTNRPDESGESHVGDDDDASSKAQIRMEEEIILQHEEEVEEMEPFADVTVNTIHQDTSPDSGTNRDHEEPTVMDVEEEEQERTEPESSHDNDAMMEDAAPATESNTPEQEMVLEEDEESMESSVPEDVLVDTQPETIDSTKDEEVSNDDDDKESEEDEPILKEAAQSEEEEASKSVSLSSDTQDESIVVQPETIDTIEKEDEASSEEDEESEENELIIKEAEQPEEEASETVSSLSDTQDESIVVQPETIDAIEEESEKEEESEENESDMKEAKQSEREASESVSSSNGEEEDDSTHELYAKATEPTVVSDADSPMEEDPSSESVSLQDSQIMESTANNIEDASLASIEAQDEKIIDRSSKIEDDSTSESEESTIDDDTEEEKEGDDGEQEEEEDADGDTQSSLDNEAKGPSSATELSTEAEESIKVNDEDDDEEEKSESENNDVVVPNVDTVESDGERGDEKLVGDVISCEIGDSNDEGNESKTELNETAIDMTKSVELAVEIEERSPVEDVQESDIGKQNASTVTVDQEEAVGEEDEDTASHLSVSVVTWNLAELAPSEEEAGFIRRFRKSCRPSNSNEDEDDVGSDLVLISGQECENTKPRRAEGNRSREFRRLMIKSLGKNYVPLAIHSLGGVQFGLFCRRAILGDVEHVNVADVACGVGNVFHNKGAIGAFVQMKARNKAKDDRGKAKSVKMLFVTAHMAAHVKNVEARNMDYWRIASELEAQAPPRFLPPSASKKVIPNTDGSTTSSPDESGGSYLMDFMDHVFFCGDLNYRIDLPREATEHLVTQMKHLAANNGEKDAKLIDRIRLELLRHDQLIRVMSEERAFPNMMEGKIAFMPTFKFDKGSATDYDTSHKQRVPAWTDRILFKPGKVRVMEYNSVPNASHSDHRPVYATFLANIEGRDISPTAAKKSRRIVRRTPRPINNGTPKKQRRKHRDEDTQS